MAKMESILKDLLKTRAIPEETARELSARRHGGFSLNASVFVDADDRDALHPGLQGPESPLGHAGEK